MVTVRSEATSMLIAGGIDAFSAVAARGCGQRFQ